MTQKADLHHYLRTAREVVQWKLDGLDEYDVRRPLVPTGTNLLGLVKHLATVEAGYFGTTFGRPFPERLAWLESDEPNADLFATAEETRDDIVGLYRRVCAHADATIDALPLDAVGTVPWWPPERREVTLHRVLVHMATETYRHAGHADIVRELVDGAVGHRSGVDNLDPPESWQAQRDRLEALARRFVPRPAPASATTAGPAEPAEVVERFNEAFNRHDVDAVMNLMSPDCVFEGTSPPDGDRHVGADQVHRAWDRLFAASPTARFGVEETIVMGERVVVRWRYDWADRAGGEPGHVRGVDVFRVVGGLIVEKLSYVKG